tara:strand:+ start:3730 stop:4092 length:363 start_codon:yes stop_codon:yes gene_type:complete
MAYHLSKDQWNELNKIGSVPMFIFSQGQVKCILKDALTDKAWHMADGGDEEQAFRNAMNSVTETNKPKTKAELAAEHKNAVQEIADLKKEVEELKPAATRKRRRSAKSTEVTETETEKPE